MPLISTMPSPSGRNDNKLFILKGRPNNPMLAYDAKGGLKGDDDPFAGMEGKNAKQIATWARENMSPDDIGELVALLTEGDAPTTASDARPRAAFGGSLKRAEAEFRAMFPSAGRAPRRV